jgi:hypothetical protein
MPTILLISGFRFFFYSNESQEPMHVHVSKASADGKNMARTEDFGVLFSWF